LQPFGEGMVTVVVPQLRRGENSLLLWSLSDLTNPVHTFIGHTDVVLEFDWKRNRQDDDDYQLVTWSKDQSLRIWRVDTNLQKVIFNLKSFNFFSIIFKKLDSCADTNRITSHPPFLVKMTPPLKFPVSTNFSFKFHDVP
jgi:WD40 repeat protein